MRYAFKVAIFGFMMIQSTSFMISSQSNSQSNSNLRVTSSNSENNKTIFPQNTKEYIIKSTRNLLNTAFGALAVGFTANRAFADDIKTVVTSDQYITTNSGLNILICK